MRIAGIVGGAILAFVGIVWMLQGFGATYVPTSFMTKAPEWIFIGLITALGGAWLAVRAWRNP
ncbi:MAG: hypothetical protein M3092_06820 [Actinomycetia bacterium]|nr:hypothetical protein [Actinomycetes bacterium]